MMADTERVLTVIACFPEHDHPHLWWDDHSLKTMALLGTITARMEQDRSCPWDNSDLHYSAVPGLDVRKFVP